MLEVVNNKEVVISSIENIKGIIEYNKDVHFTELLDEQFKKDMEYEVLVNQKNGKEKFSTFNDIQLIYYYVHSSKYIDQNKKKKETTKKTYLSDLLTFGKQLTELSDVLGIDMHKVGEKNSLFKAMEPYMLHQYCLWLGQAPLGRGGKQYSPATLKKKLSIIQSFLVFMYKNKYIQYDLSAEMLKGEVRAIDRPDRDISKEQGMQIIAALEKRNDLTSYTIILFLMTTGLRIAELCQARMNDLHEINGQIWLKVKGKGDKEREVFISQKLMEAIIAFRARRELETDNTGIVITNTRRNAYQPHKLSPQVTKWLVETGLNFIINRENKLTPHSLRHFYAIAASESGASVQNISKSLGHASIRTTEIYLEKNQKRKDHVGPMVSGIFN